MIEQAAGKSTLVRAMLGRLVSLARDHGKAILVSTHVLRDVQSICDSLVLLYALVPEAVCMLGLARRQFSPAEEA